METKTLLFVLPLAITTILAVNAVLAATSPGVAALSILDAQCDSKGTLRLLLDNDGAKRIELRDITITAKSITNTAYNKQVNGHWDVPYLDTRMRDYFDMQGMQFNFESGQGFLNESGDYEIEVNYLWCVNSLNCSEKKILANCPGYEYDCDETRLDFLSCTSDGDVLDLTYSGVNNGQYQKIGVDGLRFTIVGTKREIFQQKYADAILVGEKNDTYDVRIPVRDFGVVQRVEILSMACGTRAIKVCSQKEPINNNTEVSNSPSLPEETVCSGCPLGNSCLPLGYRVSIDNISRYCGEKSEFLVQKETDSTCQNNFECESNLCSSGMCVNIVSDATTSTITDEFSPSENEVEGVEVSTALQVRPGFFARLRSWFSGFFRN